MGLRSGGIFRVSLLRLTTLLLRFRPYEGWKVLFRMVGRPAGRPVCWPVGEAGNRTSYSPVGAGTGAELGNMRDEMRKLEPGMKKKRYNDDEKKLNTTLCVGGGQLSPLSGSLKLSNDLNLSNAPTVHLALQSSVINVSDSNGALFCKSRTCQEAKVDGQTDNTGMPQKDGTSENIQVSDNLPPNENENDQIKLGHKVDVKSIIDQFGGQSRKIKRKEIRLSPKSKHSPLRSTKFEKARKLLKLGQSPSCKSPKLKSEAKIGNNLKLENAEIRPQIEPNKVESIVSAFEENIKTNGSNPNKSEIETKKLMVNAFSKMMNSKGGGHPPPRVRRKLRDC